MKARLAIGLAAVVLSCARGKTEHDVDAKSAAQAAHGDAQKLAVKLNGYVIDVKGVAPAVPADLEPASDRRGDPRINWLSFDGEIETVAPGAPRVKTPRGSDAAKRAKRNKWIVQFEGPIHEAQKGALTELGARIGDYLPEFAFIVSMDEDTRGRVERLPFVHGVARYKPAYKISRRLKDESGAVRIEDGKKVKLRVRADAPDGLVTFLSEVHNGKGKVLHVAKEVAQVEVAQATIAHLAQLEEVLWIEEAVPLQLLNDTSRWVIQTNVPGNTRISDQGLDGTGQIVGVGDTGLDYDSCYFRDTSGAPIGFTHRKVVGYASYADDYDGNMGHGTHVSGTVAGDQAPVTANTTANGMAPKARLFMTDLTPGEQNILYPPDDLGEMFITPYDAGARIHTNSWGANINAYDTLAWSVDRFMWEHKDFLVFFANGNSGPGEATVGLPATAKDLISVGATENGELAENLAFFSSNGPASDGRIKPTLTAPGVAIQSADSDGVKGSNNCGTITYSGTSMATPTTAGAAALVRQYYVNGYWPSGTARAADGFAPSAALVKATLVNSAQGAAGDYTGGPIPSTGQGWGRINLSNTLRFAADPKLLDVLDSADGLVTGTSWSKRYYSLGGTPLKVTLVWTDYPALQGADKTLVNDLDLEVTAPDGTTTYLGNAFAAGASVAGGSADRLNVEEQVFIPVSARGAYTIRVNGHNLPFGPQPFAVVIAGAAEVTPHGLLSLDRTRYGAATTVAIQVSDRDLDLSPDAVDEAYVTIRSDADPAGEVVRLLETGPATALFKGTIRTGPAPGTPGDGILGVAEGAIITATYEDADDGTGLPATVTETAIGDVMPPVILSISVAPLGQGDATITWITNEPAAPVIVYGESPALGATQSSPAFGTTHSVKLAGLKEATTYYYAVQATDEAGNLARDDAGGGLYTFTTRTLPPDVEVYSSRGEATHYSDTVVFGTARDPSGVVSLTVNGQPVTPRVTDGYYEIAEPLAVGDNVFTVVAADGLGQVQTTVLTVTRIPLPDLIVRSVSSPDRAGVGMPFSSTAEICNVGPGAAELPDFQDSWHVAWFLTDDQTGYGIVIRNVTRWGGGMPPGACFTLTQSMTAGFSFGGRTFHLGVMADLYDDIWEENEDNNAEWASNPITIEKPDLVVTTVVAPESVGTATPFDVTTMVANVGLGLAQPGWQALKFYLSTDDVITAADRLIATEDGWNWAPGGMRGPESITVTTSVSLPCDIAPGRYRLGVIVDERNNVSESDETNNVTLGPWITVAAPDLEMVAVNGPTTALTGDAVVIHDEVRALPTGGGASEFKVAFYLSTDPVIRAPDAADTTGDLWLGERTVPGLASGASSSADTAAAIPRTVAGGTYYIGAIADPTNQLLEGVESNNAAAGNTIAIVGPDLVATAVSAPASAVTGETIIVQDTVAASASGGAAPEFDVGIYFSIDPVITPSDTLIGWRHVPALQPGGSSTGSTAVALPTNLAPGTYYVGVIADDFTYCWEDQWETRYCVGGDVAKESNTANNAVSTPLVIGVTDLTMTDVSVAASGASGMPLVVHDTVHAAGGAAGWFSIKYYLSLDETMTGSDVYLGQRVVLGLAAGASSTADTTFTVPVGIIPSTYHIAAIADAQNEVPESNEGNNVRVGNTVTIQGADLVVMAVTGPETVAANATFGVTTTVMNVGQGRAPGFYVPIYLSTDAAITTSDSKFTHRMVEGLAPGASSTATTYVSVSVPGTYYLGAIADEYNWVNESNESNNALASSPMTVTGP